jgi:hypothetical protein
MAFWESLAEGSLKGLVGGVGELFKDVRTAITGKEPLTSEQQIELIRQMNALETMAASLESKAADGQIELNKIDAESGSLFKGGWRPALGWCCVLGLIYTFLVRPLLPWSVQVAALIVDKIVVLPAMPPLDTKELMALVLALLGFGGFRMYERVKGKS